ncbi:MAG: 2-keto-3-deoxygluconate kinase [Blastococcus sp.]|nr:2-keto-3-deoxygluconate kinase [Blastococcus sp.]
MTNPETAASSAPLMEALCIGETMVMVTPSPGGRLDAASSFLLRPGGAESNVAMYLAGLGHRAAWLSRVGDDPLGRLILSEVAAAGVDISLVEVSGTEPTGVYFKDPQPEGTRVHYYRRGSAASTMGSDLLRRVPRSDLPLLHATGITPALSEQCRLLVRHLLTDRPFGPGTTVSFDVNYRPALWQDGSAAGELLALARAADIVFVGLDEAGTLWNARTAEDVRALLPEPSVVVVKDGAVEASAFHRDGTERVSALRVEVVEPVGAGDAFAAGWLSGMLSGRGHTERLRLGHLVAGAALRSTGDHATLPARETLLAALALDDAGWRRGPAFVAAGGD